MGYIQGKNTLRHISSGSEVLKKENTQVQKIYGWILSSPWSEENFSMSQNLKAMREWWVWLCKNKKRTFVQQKSLISKKRITVKTLCKFSHRQRLITLMYENLHTEKKKANRTVEKWTTDMHRYFIGKEMRRTLKHMERCSISLLIKEMQNKTLC